MYMNLVGRMMCNEYKRNHKGHFHFKKLLDRYPSILYVAVLFGVPLISLCMVFALIVVIMYPVSLLFGWV